MPDMTQLQRLQPCLLDRLTDDDPASQVESRERRVISLKRYRDGVLRDLAWLLNAGAPRPEDGFADFDQVARSVLCFGIRDTCGRTASSISTNEMEAEIISAIERFEPRLIRSSLSVQVNVSQDAMNTNAMSFQIKGELWALPMPEMLDVKTEIDLETGRWDVKDRSNG